LQTAAVLTLVLGAALWDWRLRKIPNWLCLGGFFAGLVLNDWRVALGGAGLALAIYLPLFVLRATGGGDVKLMVALGALLGVEQWFRVFLISAVLGGVVALGIVVRERAGRETLQRIGFVWSSLLRGGRPYEERPELDVQSGRGRMLPRGVVVAAATLVWLAWR
jgi:prepilin peptidase CpaA